MMKKIRYHKDKITFYWKDNKIVLLKHFKNNGLSEFQIGFVLGIIIDEVAEGQTDDYEHEEFEESMLKMPEENNVLEPSFGFNS